MSSYVFVGERPSRTALERNWRWKDGRLAAKQLFDALLFCGLTPEDQCFLNLFVLSEDRVNPFALNRIRQFHLSGCEIVSMGQKVARVLEARAIDFILIPHPAARGRIRKKEVYQEVVKNALRSRTVPKRVPGHQG